MTFAIRQKTVSTALSVATLLRRPRLCRRGAVRGAPEGFRNGLSFLTGSYHLNDYGIFDESLRRNAVERVDAWRAKTGDKSAGDVLPMSHNGNRSSI